MTPDALRAALSDEVLRKARRAYVDADVPWRAPDALDELADNECARLRAFREVLLKALAPSREDDTDIGFSRSVGESQP